MGPGFSDCAIGNCFKPVWRGIGRLCRQTKSLKLRTLTRDILAPDVVARIEYRVLSVKKAGDVTTE